MSQFIHDFEAAALRAQELHGRRVRSSLAKIVHPSLLRTSIRYEIGERSVLEDCYLTGGGGGPSDNSPCDVDELRQLAQFRLVSGARSWINGGGLPPYAHDSVTEASLGSAVAFAMRVVASHTIGGEATMALAVDMLRRYVALPRWRHVDDDDVGDQP